MNKVIQVRDVPSDVHRRLKARAAEQGRTLSELVREQLEEAARRPSMAEMLDRLAAREAVDPGESSADAVRAGRDDG
jgi:plasmid stability protein